MRSDLLIFARIVLSTIIVHVFSGHAEAQDASLSDSKAEKGQLLPYQFSGKIDFLNHRLRDLKEKERALEARAGQLSKQSLLLANDIKILRELVRDLRQAKDELEQLVDFSSKTSHDRVKQIISIFEEMDIAAAAQVLSGMPPAYGAEILARLKKNTAAAIFSKLPSKVAYAFAAHLSSGNFAPNKKMKSSLN